MLLSINPINAIRVHTRKSYETANHTAPIVTSVSKNSELSGVPASYISFRANDSTRIKLTNDAQVLFERAKEVAKSYNHSEITGAHVIQAAINEHYENIESLNEEVLSSGAIESVSTLNKLVNNYAKTNTIKSENARLYEDNLIQLLEEDNIAYLEAIPPSEEPVEDLDFSDDMKSMLKEVEEKAHSIDPYMLLGVGMNALTAQGLLFPQEFIKGARSYSHFLKMDDIKPNYMKVYDNRALELWNKLALGSNMAVIYEDEKEIDRMTASFVKQLDAEKYGNFNSDNTRIFVMSRDITDEELVEEIDVQKEIDPDIQKIYLVNFNQLLINSSQDDNTFSNPANFNQLLVNPDRNTRLVFFQSNDVYYTLAKDPNTGSLYKNFLTYSIPPIQSYEVSSLMNKNMLKDIEHPFSRDAKERAIYHSGNMEGIYPDKAVDLMKRISVYYGKTKKKITSKEVDEFAQIANELFNRTSNKTEIIYDTGKNLASMYGKETTKKDVEAIIRQIKTGNIGTKGILIYSKDLEAGAGRRYTAETIAGEAKIPFIPINSSDFAKYERVTSSEGSSESPKSAMSRVFGEAKKVARQNQYKTAMIYISNFEEFAFSSPYLPGYKQAMSQLTEEMKQAVSEDVSILVVGSTEEEYAEIIPMIVRGFNQNITVDSPAFNKKSRKEILEHQISDIKLPLAYKNSEDKEYMMNKLVKLTEYMSFVQIKSLVQKAEQIMYERNKKKAAIGEFIEAYLQMATGRTSHPEMQEFNKQATTSHECGHATNLEVMSDILKRRGKPWHQSENVNFITLDPRGDFLGAVFEGKADNTDYPFEAMFTGLVCSYGGYSCEKKFFGTDGSAGICQDLAQASTAVKRGIEYFGLGHNTGKISNAVGIKSGEYNESVFKDMKVILTNAQIASDLITDCYKGFNEWFTQKFSKLIGSDDCMIDGDDFRKSLFNWKNSLSADKKEEINIMEDMVMEIIESSKKGKIYGKVKEIAKPTLYNVKLLYK